MSGAGTETQQKQDIIGRSVSGLEPRNVLPIISAFLLDGFRDVAWWSICLPFTGTECDPPLEPEQFTPVSSQVVLLVFCCFSPEQRQPSSVSLPVNLLCEVCVTL